VSWVLFVVLTCSATGFAQNPTVNSPSTPAKVMHVEQFTGESPTALVGKTTSLIVSGHTRSPEPSATAGMVEQLIFQSGNTVPNRRIEVPVPPARVFDELTGTIKLRATCQHVSMALLIRFPGQVNPQTGEPLTMEFAGDSYSSTPDWQTLTCRTSDKAIQSRLIRLRGQLATGGNPIRLDGPMYVDRMVISFQVPAGGSGIQFDELKIGPIVSPATQNVPMQVQTAPVSPLKLEGDRVLKNGKPFFPIFTVYHGESLDTVAETGVNTVWIPDYHNKPLLRALAQMDIGAFAQPPRPQENGDVQQTSGLRSIPDWTSPVWAWMLGVEIPANELSHISHWVDQVRDADRAQQRPILADVQGNERSFHRRVSFLGTSQFGAHTDLNPKDYFYQLRQRQNRALPGKPMFTFVQTEAAGSLLDHRPKNAPLPIVEPEQILLQAYASIAAGYKGIGFWKQIPFTEDQPGLNERIHAIRLFTSHCKVIEPWLATGTIADDVPVMISNGKSDSRDKSLLTLSTRWDAVRDENGQLRKIESDVRATTIITDRGMLILPCWFEDGGQCVPGPQAATGIRLFVRGGGDFAQAWEVTPTSVGQLNLELKRIAGGTEIHLKNFDRHSAIVISSDPNLVTEMQDRMRGVRASAAQSAVSLAQLKYERVSAVHDELLTMAPAVSDAEAYLRSAEVWLTRAQDELTAGHHHDARIASQKALQYVRTLQRRHWINATSSMPSITSSLDTVCFQTLPYHYQQLAEIARRRESTGNLIPSGGFDDERSLVDGGWLNASSEQAKCHLDLRPGSIGECLSLSVHNANLTSSEPGLISSPEIPVLANEIVVISGMVLVPNALQRSRDGLLIYEAFSETSRTQIGSFDSTSIPGNRTAAVRWHQPTNGWKKFTLIRQMPTDGFLHLRVELDSPGTILLDEVQVKKLEL